MRFLPQQTKIVVYRVERSPNQGNFKGFTPALLHAYGVQVRQVIMTIITTKSGTA